MIQLPVAFQRASGNGPGPEWPAIRASALTAHATNQLPESPRAIHLSTASTVRVVMAGEDDTHAQASLTVGAGNARFTATAIPLGAAGNDIRIAVAASSSAAVGLTLTTATASGVTTITFTYRTGTAVTAEFLVLAFQPGGSILGTEADIALARSLVSIALTSGSDGSADIGAVAARALTGGSSTSPAVTFALQAGIHEIAIRKFISATGGAVVTGLF